MTTITQKRTTKTMADAGHQSFTKSVFYTPPPLKLQNRQRIINCFDAD